VVLHMLRDALAVLGTTGWSKILEGIEIAFY
jgi:hypothetical protein